MLLLLLFLLIFSPLQAILLVEPQGMPVLPCCKHHMKRGFLAELGMRRVDLLAMAALQFIVGLVGG